MNILFDLISQLEGPTLGHAGRRVDPGSGMALLLDLYKKAGQQEPDDEKIREKIYGKKGDRNTLYRLKNRLLFTLNNALVELHTAEGQDLFITEQNLMLFHIFRKKGLYKLAGYYLQKAEKSGLQKEQYALLDIIYGEYIVFSKDFLLIDPEAYIIKRRSNEEVLKNFKMIDEILAVITYRLKITQNMSGKLNVSFEIENTLGAFAGNENIFKSTQFKIKFYKTISQILVQQKKYAELEKYLEQTYADFKKADIFTKQTHDIKVEQLVYLGNSLLMQRKYDKAIKSSSLLFDALKEYGNLLYDKYIYFFYQLQINSYAAIDVDKAVVLLQEVVGSKKMMTDSYYLLINYANLAFLWFVQKKFKQVLKTLQSVYRNDFFENTDLHLKAQLAVLEMLTRYELDDPDTFEYRVKQVHKSFQTEWAAYEGIDKDLLVMAEKMMVNPRYKKDPVTRAMAANYLKANMHNENRIFNYDAWIREKLGNDLILT